MWNQPNNDEQKNKAATSEDNKNKEELEDCKCSASSSEVSVGQPQSLSTADEKANSKKSVPTTQDRSDDNAPSASAKKHQVVSEAIDSGFISGPQSEPIEYDEDDDEEQAAVTSAPESKQNDENRNKDNAVNRHTSSTGVQRGPKTFVEQQAVTDSGCLTEEVYDEEDDDVAAAVSAAASSAVTEANTTKPSQVVREQSSTTVATTGTETGTVNMRMKTLNLTHAVGASEWTCEQQHSNNLNAIGRRPSATSGNTGMNSSNVASSAAAGSASAPIKPTGKPWEQFYKQNDDGDTALHLSCIAGCLDVITALIRMAPHPCLFNIQNDEAQTPLHLAALTAQPNILRILLLAGAEPTVRDRHGNTALHLACIAGEIQCVRALTETFAASEIHEAHRQYGHRSNDKVMSSLNFTRLPSDLEIRNYDGERCVHLAAQAGHIDILRILVSHGADINAREGKSGRTPLHIAIECRNEDLANFLLDECEKLNLETATYAGLTAYQVAHALNNAQMQNILQKRGAEPLTPPDSDYDSSDIEDLDDSKTYDRFGDPRYFVNYNGGNPMTVA